MDFLNTALGQLNDLFRSMTVGARITAGLLLAVVVVSLGYLFNHEMAGGDTYLLGGQSFSTSELNAMEGAFSSAGLGGYELEGGRVRIPRSEQAVYVAALAEAQALPMNWNDSMARALEDTNPFMTQKERDERMLLAKQQNLALVLKSMKDVANATVHYDSQKKPGLGQERNATASVVIQLVGGRSLDDQRVEMIRGMVTASFADLSSDKVTISDLNGRVHSGSSKDGIGEGHDHRYISTKLAFQKEYEKSIYEALAYVPGVTVAANVELEKDLHRTTHSIEHDPKSVPVAVREETSTSKSESASPRGAPGLTVQQPQPNQAARVGDTARGSTTEEEKSNREERNLVNSKNVTSEEIGLTPRRVTVSVGIPTSYFEEVWRRQNPTPPGQPPQTPDPKALADIETEETTKIQNHVVPLIPKPTDVLDPTPLVTVSKFHPITPPPIPTPSAAAETMAWLGQHWSTLGLGGLALASLFMLRSMIRSNLPESRSTPFNLPRAEAEQQAGKPEQAEAEAKPSRLKRRTASGTSLRDELADLVRDDPDAAANILRGWIGNAS